MARPSGSERKLIQPFKTETYSQIRQTRKTDLHIETPPKGMSVYDPNKQDREKEREL